MKRLIFFLIILLTSFQLHADSTEECVQEKALPATEIPSFVNDVYSSIPDANFRSEFCDAVNACMGMDERDCSYTQQRYKSSVNRTGSATCNMSPEELTLIGFYTSAGYGCLNKYLRNPSSINEGDKIQKLVETLDRALSRLPRYEGFVLRGGSLPEAVQAQHQVGAEVEYAAYTSTSTATGFQSNERFLIYSQAGRPIMGFSDFESENEVLFASRTKFRVITVAIDGSQRVYLMREVRATETPEEAAREDERVKNVAQSRSLAYQVQQTLNPASKPAVSKVYPSVVMESYFSQPDGNVLKFNTDGTSQMYQGSDPELIGKIIIPPYDFGNLFPGSSGGKEQGDKWICPRTDNEEIPKVISQDITPEHLSTLVERLGF